jgi:hypothetical protein
MNMQTEPIVLSEVIKLALRIVALLVSAGYLTSGEAEQLSVIVPVLAFAVVELVNWLITWYKQRGVVFSPATVEELTNGQHIQ